MSVMAVQGASAARSAMGFGQFLQTADKARGALSEQAVAGQKATQARSGALLESVLYDAWGRLHTSTSMVSSTVDIRL